MLISLNLENSDERHKITYIPTVKAASVSTQAPMLAVPTVLP